MIKTVLYISLGIIIMISSIWLPFYIASFLEWREVTWWTIPFAITGIIIILFGCSIGYVTIEWSLQKK